MRYKRVYYFFFLYIVVMNSSEGLNSNAGPFLRWLFITIIKKSIIVYDEKFLDLDITLIILTI